MDRDGFVEFVQWTLVERKTKGSKVVTRSRGAVHTNVIAQSMHVACINQLAS